MKYQDLLDVATFAAQAGGETLMRLAQHRETLRIEVKAEADFVTAADRDSEEKIVSHLLKAFPDHQILAEEHTQAAPTQPTVRPESVQWVIDPLDGTTNYIHGVPNFSISIAAKQNDAVLAGVVWDPVRRELFTAIAGGGAFPTATPPRFRQRASARQLIGTGFPFRVRHHLNSYLRMFQELMSQSRDIRRLGSAALDLAYVAAGRFDGFWEYNLNPWDFAAGALLVREAGGLITGFAIDEDFWVTGNILATNGKLHELMREIILSSQPQMSANQRE
jgi:myo-inositol-1(or 4)-monophosphatase